MKIWACLDLAAFLDDKKIEMILKTTPMTTLEAAMIMDNV
jgi:hypothetical protein